LYVNAAPRGDCEIKSYSLSDEQMSSLGNDAELITYKTTVDGTCGGQKVPANSWAASVYVRDGDQWKGVFHAESPVVDPTAAAARPLANKEAPKAHEAKPADRDAGTDAILGDSLKGIVNRVGIARARMTRCVDKALYSASIFLLHTFSLAKASLDDRSMIDGFSRVA